MMTYVFPGFMPFLVAAAGKLEQPYLAGPASRSRALTTLSDLCAQAVRARPEEQQLILDEADRLRDEIRAALLAADLILADVRAGLGLEPPCPSRASRPPRRCRRNPQA